MTTSPWGSPNDIDPEVIDLCRALNSLPGIATVESCCGHGERPFQVYFKARNLDVLRPVAYWTSACHSGYPGWQVIARTDCGMAPITFILEGPVGAEGYEGAEAIADCLVGSRSK